MKKVLLVGCALAALVVPASARLPFLLDTIDNSRWAIDGECNAPAKTYVASVKVGDGTSVITWQDGLGNTDVEWVFYSQGNEFRTLTVSSIHNRRDNSPGTGWIYKALNDSFDTIRITKFGKPFYVSRCYE
jgi:hypothetical protein